MNRLLKHSVSLAAAAILFSGAAGVLAQTDEDDGAVAAIPMPEECIVEPLDQTAIDAALSAGAAQPVLPQGLPVPLGTPADRDAERAVVETTRQLLACLNANDISRAAALFSESGLQGFYTTGAGSGADSAATATPGPRTEQQYLRLRTVTDVSILEDGRTAAFVLLGDPLLPGTGPQTLLFVFTDVDGRLAIDGVVGFSLISPAGTPTAGTPTAGTPAP